MGTLQWTILFISLLSLSTAAVADESGQFTLSGDLQFEGNITVTENDSPILTEPSLPASSDYADWQDLTMRPQVFFHVVFTEAKDLVQNSSNGCSEEFKTSANAGLESIAKYYDDYETKNLGQFIYPNLTVETEFYALVRNLDSINSSSCHYANFRSPWNASLRILYGLDPSVKTPIPGGRPINELPAQHSKLDIAKSLTFGSGVRYLYLQNGPVIEPLYTTNKELPSAVVPDMPFCYVGLKDGIEGYVELRPRSQMRFDMKVKNWEFNGIDYDYVVFSDFRKRTSQQPNYDQNYTTYWDEGRQTYYYEVKDQALRIVACFQPTQNRTEPGSLFVTRNLQYLLKSNGLNLWLPIMSAVTVSPISFGTEKTLSEDPGDEFLVLPMDPRPNSVTTFL